MLKLFEAVNMQSLKILIPFNTSAGVPCMSSREAYFRYSREAYALIHLCIERVFIHGSGTLQRLFLEIHFSVYI